jgi:hypothetical protein
MPTLADIYSYIDTQKRKAANLIRSPGATLQEMAALAGDEARQINRETALSSQGRRQEMVGQPMTAEQTAAREALMERAGEAALGGMTVWHGSPYMFTKFDPKKIGTGEGAQKYGYGLYVAQNPNVADEYRMMLSQHKVTGNPAQDLANYSLRMKPSITEAIEFLQKEKNDVMRQQEKGFQFASSKNFVTPEYLQQYDDAIDVLKSNKGQKPGNLYKIDLPDEHIEKMLDWDKRISKQSELIQNAWKNWQQTPQAQKLKNQMVQQGRSEKEVEQMLANPTGETMHKLIYEGYGSLRGGENKKVAKFLKEQGLAGVKYEDAGTRSRLSNQPTQNFVIFPGNEAMLKIEGINDVLVK